MRGVIVMNHSFSVLFSCSCMCSSMSFSMLASLRIDFGMSILPTSSTVTISFIKGSSDINITCFWVNQKVYKDIGILCMEIIDVN